MNILMKGVGLLSIIFCFTAMSLATAASLHGHRHQHTQEELSGMVKVYVKHNTTSKGMDIVQTEEREEAAVPQKQRYPPSLRHLYSSREEQPQRLEDEGEEISETRSWMGGSLAILALGLVLGAEMAG